MHVMMLDALKKTRVECNWDCPTSSFHGSVALALESPNVLNYPKITTNSDHGLSFPTPET